MTALALTLRSYTRPALVWLNRNTRRIVWIVGFAWIFFFWGMVIAYVGAPALRSLIDAATTRPAICAGLGAGECGEAVGTR